MKPKITLIAAMNKEQVIGVNNQLPWHIPEDLAYFKGVTLGKPIIMGRKTFESIGKLLPGRQNVVITRNSAWQFPGVTVFADIDTAIQSFDGVVEVCFIGGGEIFKQVLPTADCLHLTTIDIKVTNPDAFFPVIDWNEWQCIAHSEIMTKDNIRCNFNEYVRKHLK